MKYALVIVEPHRDTGHEGQNAWLIVTNHAKDRTVKSGKVEILTEGCYLCDLDNGLLDLGNIVAAASNYGLHTRTLFFDQKPAFVVT